MQSWLSKLIQQGHQFGIRQVILMPGPMEHTWLQLVKHKSILGNIISIGETPSDPNHSKQDFSLNLKANRPDNLLGHESQCVIFNAHSGLYPDALTAIAGTLTAGGLLFILCPSLKTWPDLEDAFSKNRHPHGVSKAANSPKTIARLLSCRSNFACYTLEINQPLPIIKDIPLPTWQSNILSGPTKSQAITLSALANSHFKGLHVITADRGRGKSYLLGLLAFEISKIKGDNGINFNKGSAQPNIYLSAPNKRAAQIVLDNCSHPIQYLPPEEILSTVKRHDFLLIDEAASLPIPLLMQLSEQLDNIIFTTTIHGYEGTGKGFQIRFFKHLDALQTKSPTKTKWHHHQLNEPVRYCQQDPLEAWLFDAFCLNASPKGLENSPLLKANMSTEENVFRKITADQLQSDSNLLNEVFGLLVQAHYQTKPSDLRDLLDAPNLHIFALFSAQNIISICLLTDEGPIDDSSFEKDKPKNIESLHTQILHGYRRPKGHLIPQSLAYYMGISSALNLKGARIMRIATLPNMQRKQYGQRLLDYCEQWFKEHNYDYLGSSFAATNDVLNFWQVSEFEKVRIGNKLDKASGTFSALVLKGLSKQGIELQQKTCHEFQQNQKKLESPTELSSHQLTVLMAFAHFKGSFDSAMSTLKQLPMTSLPFNDFPKKATQNLRDKVKEWLDSFNRH